LIDQLTEQSDTPDRIVEVARELFFDQGYAATGIAQILKASGTKSGSLYYFFPSKEDLLAAVLKKYKEMLGPRVVGPALSRTSDPIERLFGVLDGYRVLLQATEFRLGCPIGNLALEVSNDHPRVRTLIVENFEAWCTAIAGMIEDASARLPQPVEARALARHVLATMEGAVMLARAYRSFEPFDDAVRQLRDYFDRMLRDGSEDSPRTVAGATDGESRRNEETRP
jgi:AcrR family transcriptional regulator